MLHRISKLFSAMSVVVFLSIAGSPGHGADPIDIQGSSWSTRGTLETRIKKFGKVRFSADLDLLFGPQVVSVDTEYIPLGANQVLLILREGDTETLMPGTYTTNNKGKPTLLLDGERVEEAIEMFLEVEGQVNLQKLKVVARPKSKQGQETIKVRLRNKFTVTAEGTTILVRQSYKGVGSRLPAPQ